MGERKERRKVRVERVDTKCGSVDHMTVDQIKERTMGKDVELACPECGEVHLTPEEAHEAGQRKVTKTRRYQKMKAQAEES